MQNKLYFSVLGMILWSGFGAIIGSLSANILNYTWVTQTLVVGAIIGMMTGLIIGLAGLSASSRFQFSAVDAQELCGIQSIYSVNRTPAPHPKGRDGLACGLGQPVVNLTQFFKDFYHEHYSANHCSG